MEYIYDEKEDMTMKQYFDRYKDKLPDLIIVTGGYYGLTQYDDYASDQILRFTTYSSQPRVIARDSSGALSSIQLEYYNIPVDTNYRFRVVHGPTHIGQEEKLSEILKKHEIPVLVRFVDSHIPELSSVENHERTKTNYLIVKKFEENYLLGNCVMEGVVNPAVTTAALTNNIYVARITGIKGKSEEEFKKLLADMDDVIKKKTKFNLQSGNPAMAKLYKNSNDTGTGASIDPDDPLIPGEVVFYDRSSVPPPLPPPRAGSIGAEGESPDADENYSYIDPPPKITTKQGQNHKKVDKNQHKQKHEKQPSAMPLDVPPDLPPRPTERKFSTQEVSPDPKMTYANDIQRCVVSPTSQSAVQPSIETQSAVQPTAESDSLKTETEMTSSSYVADLTISEVGEVLKKLQLDKYVQTFEDQLIDGTILQELEKSDFVNDFNFSGVEAIRLLKFVKTGHVPR